MHTYQSDYKKQIPFEDRRKASMEALDKWPNSCPLVCEKAPGSYIQESEKKKYLVPGDLTVGQFIYVLRRKIKLTPEKALFIFVNGTLPPSSALISAVYKEHKDEDGFLYVVYSGENTFGN